MAHVKIVHVHNAIVLAALHQYLAAQPAPAMPPQLAGSLTAAVRAHLVDDASELSGLPPDARIVGHAVEPGGEAVSLVFESDSFPWVPDGLPLAQMPELKAFAAGGTIPAGAPILVGEATVDRVIPKALADKLAAVVQAQQGHESEAAD